MKQSMSHDDLGDRMKLYERQEAGRHFMPRLPIVARLDGRAFHSFTRGLDQPYSNLFMQCMVNTAHALVHQTNAVIAYRQSDEITLIWPGQQNLEEFWFGGRVQKMCSLLASIATLEFNLQVRELLSSVHVAKKPMFDCRVWQVPDEIEATNVLVWRENDAVKNSIMAMALSVVGHKAVLNKNQKEQLDLIHGGNQNWNHEPAWAKRGTYISRQRVTRPFTCEELAALPPKHNARTNPDLVVERAEIRELELPRITSVFNRVAVVFEGAEPITLPEATECQAG